MPVDDVTRRRFYLVGADMRCNPSDFSFVNREQALIGGRMAGSHTVTLPGTEIKRTFGLPPLQTRPALMVGVDDDELLDMYGLGKRFVSSKAKALLESIDPDAFEFAECDTIDGRGRQCDPYWMMDVVRVCNDMDESRSSFVTYSQLNPDADDAKFNPFITMINEVVFDDDCTVGHAFYILKHQAHFVFDQRIVDAWRGEGMTGVIFTPLQMPTDQERLLAVHFANRPYWNERG